MFSISFWNRVIKSLICSSLWKQFLALISLFTWQRAALGPNVTKITLECFIAWKRRKRQEKLDKAEQDMERRKADFKAGKALVVCSTLQFLM